MLRLASLRGGPAASSTWLPRVRVLSLPSGLRVAVQRVPGALSAVVGVWIGAGSADDKEALGGTAHLLEHVSFKGSRNWTQSGLEKTIEDRGAVFDAYTARETTAFVARGAKEDYPTLMYMLREIACGSTLDWAATEAEKHIVWREMQEVGGDPHDVLLELLHRVAFPGSPLGAPILGTRDSVRRVTADDVRQFRARCYVPRRMVVVCCGDVDAESFAAQVSRGLEKLLLAPRASPAPLVGGSGKLQRVRAGVPRRAGEAPAGFGGPESSSNGSKGGADARASCSSSSSYVQGRWGVATAAALSGSERERFCIAFEGPRECGRGLLASRVLQLLVARSAVQHGAFGLPCLSGYGGALPTAPTLGDRVAQGSSTENRGRSAGISSLLYDDFVLSAFSAPYRRTGLWGFYGDGSRGSVSHVAPLLRGELLRLLSPGRSTGVRTSEVEQAKATLRLQLSMELRDPLSRCDVIARQLLAQGRVQAPWETLGELDKVSRTDVVRVARRLMLGVRPTVVYAPGPPGRSKTVASHLEEAFGAPLKPPR